MHLTSQRLALAVILAANVVLHQRLLDLADFSGRAPNRFNHAAGGGMTHDHLLGRLA